MTVSNSPLAFSDCYAVITEAVTDPKGARVKMLDEKSATFFRLRCHQARFIDRRLNAETYPKGHPLHGVSEYDRLTLRLREEPDGWWVYLEQNAVIPGEVQSLSTGAALQFDLPFLEIQQPRALPAPTPPTDAELAEAFDGIEAVDEAPAKPFNRRI